jgi:hypothetical protein
VSELLGPEFQQKDDERKIHRNKKAGHKTYLSFQQPK